VSFSPAAALTDLVASAHRLTRRAAAEAGETTSSTAYRTLSILLERGPSRIGDLAAATRSSAARSSSSRSAKRGSRRQICSGLPGRIAT
jgi:hypothetical protein